MHHSNNDRNFHLQAINIVKTIFSHPPHGVHAKAIYTILYALNMLSFLSVFDIETRPKQVQVHREKVVVDKAAICSKEAHHGEQVAVRDEHREGRGFCFYVWVLEYEVQSESKEDEPVGDVAEHDPEQKRERDGCEYGWIGLTVLGYTVGLDDFLCGAGELIT